MAYAWPTDEEQSHPSAITGRHNLAQDLLQNPCLWTPLLLTSPKDWQEWSLPPQEDVRTSLRPSLLSRSHKECWFTFGDAEGLFISPNLCWAIKNIYSRNNMSSPPQMSLHYFPCFFKQYSYPEKLTSTTQADLQTTQHRLCHYAECNVLDLG